MLFAAAAFGQGNSGKNGNGNNSSNGNTSKNNKIDDKLNDKVNTSKADPTKTTGKEKIRVIIQHVVPPSAAEKNDVEKNGGKITKELTSIKAIVVELTVDQIEKEAVKPNVKKVSIDEPVKSFFGTTEASVVSGAALATQTYGVTGSGVGVAVIDSGIAVHPDLTNVVAAVDFVDSNRHGGYDPFGHGTHVAGIVAGSGAASSGAHKGVRPASI